jgi:predicted transcriptional regulator
MDSIKSEAHKMIDSLPDNVTWDQLVDRFDMRRSIEQGLADVEAGRVLTQEEAEAEVEKWLVSRGRKKRLVG